jgi:hypothetical protein
MMRKAWFIAVALAAVVACGKSTGNGNEDGGTGGSGGSGGGIGTVNDAGLPDGGKFIPCPTEKPFNDTACLPDERRCEYGDDPRGPRCRPLAICDQGNWSVIDPGCVNAPTATCPATREQAQGQACDPFDAYCSYDGGLSCHCTDCTDGPAVMCAGMGKETWHCQAPHADSECPEAMPNLGVACLPEGKTCTYGCDLGRRCENRVWVKYTPPGGCPVSSRRAKRDVHYLTDAERQSLASQVLSTPLATYEYTDPALAGSRRLGFIIEDRPSAFSVNPEANQVDLYGYVSELLATVQEQHRQISALREEVDALKRAQSKTRPLKKAP